MSARTNEIDTSAKTNGAVRGTDETVLSGACTLDHDGCVVCADAGIPVRILSLEGDDALCEDAAGNRACIAVELVAPVRVGEVVLAHGGVAIGRAEGWAARREEES